jgi:hypothetical protein
MKKLIKLYPNDYDLGKVILENNIIPTLIKKYPNYRELGRRFRKIQYKINEL